MPTLRRSGQGAAAKSVRGLSVSRSGANRRFGPPPPDPEEVKHAFGKHLKARREGTGLSQEDFALHSGIKRSHIGKMEQGACAPSFQTLIQLARACGMTLSEFLEGLDQSLPSSEPVTDPSAHRRA